MSDRERFLKTLGARIAAARKREELTQAQLGEMLGLSQQVMADYETGTRQLQVWRLVQVADALGVGVAELVGRDDERRPRKRGPTPKIQKQLEAIADLPKAKRAFVSEVLTNILKESP